MSNTIHADLQRTAILKKAVRAFATRVLPLRTFCTSFQNVALQGTDEATVPYFPLQSAASKDFVQADGYVFDKDTNTSSKKVTLNKRKYQPLEFSSSELSRQPMLNREQLAIMAAEKLADDVMRDILSIITVAKFGASVKTIPAAAYTSDDVADLATACNDLNWPDSGRGLVVSTAVDGTLKKDNAFKLALNIGGTEVIRGGKLPKIGGFEYAFLPNFPTNGENLIGFVSFMSAILAAFAPVAPAPGVRENLLAYEIVTDDATGISLNYRRWGNPDADVDREIIECAYGYEAGEANALLRLSSQ